MACLAASLWACFLWTDIFQFRISFMSAGIFLNQFHILVDDRLYLYVDIGKAKGKDLELSCSNIGAGIGGIGRFFCLCRQRIMTLRMEFLTFAVSREFYYVPFFGWGKLVLSSFLGKEYLGMIIGLFLLLAANAVFVMLFLTFPRNIVEQAVRDAEEISNYVRRVKANGGNILSSEGKIKQVRGEFPEGARAIFYKNILCMKKTGSFFKKTGFLCYCGIFCYQLFHDTGETVLHV